MMGGHVGMKLLHLMTSEFQGDTFLRAILILGSHLGSYVHPSRYIPSLEYNDDCSYQINCLRVYSTLQQVFQYVPAEYKYIQSVSTTLLVVI